LPQIAVFFLTRTDQVQVQLRRYTMAADRPCPGSQWGCDASVVIAAAAPEADWGVEPGYDGRGGDLKELVAHDDPRWPTACGHCAAAFAPEHRHIVHVDRLYAGTPGGELHTIRRAPVGAMWDAFWHEGLPAYTGPDGIALVVRTPGGDWMVDSEASNCTRKGDLTHKCWIRHGDPRDPQGLKGGRALHVDKSGDTCAAGAGSIISGSYHGFLHNGHLVDC
jgi:hypothetical protein